MNPVKVKNIEIGTGMPKIIVPIVGVTKEEILTTARSFHTIPLDVVEWRADWFEGVFDFTQVEDVLKELRNILGETPLLMTFRTSAEGGEKSISVDAYKELNIHASQTGNVDLIDVELENVKSDYAKDFLQFVRELSVECHKNNIILSTDNYKPERTLLV